MKKLLAILLALILCVGTLSVVSFAANDITVHAYVPSEWGTPHIYGWGNDASVAWPGTAMTQEDGQWYVGTLSANDANVIINNGDGQPQTIDMAFDGGYPELWVVVGTAGGDGKFSGTVYYAEDEVQMPSEGGDQNPGEDQPSGDANAADPNGKFAAPSSLAIVGSGIPGVGEWNPADAAGDMTANGLVYEIELSCPAGTTMTFKFAGNDAWDDSCNLGSGTAAIGSTTDLVNDGGSSDMTLSVDKDCVLKFTVDLTALADKSGAATLTIAEVEGGSTETPDDQPGEDNPPAEGNVKVHARIPESWGENPCFWAWKMADNTNAFSAWPGEVMTKNGEWFEIEIPNWCDGVIVNDGGSTQTPDLQVEAGKEIWIDVYTYEDIKVTYSDPGERVEPTEPSEDPTEPSEEPTEPSETEPSETEPTEPSETQPTESNKDKENNDKELRAKKKTHTILIIVMVVVWVVVVAELITILLKKKI